MISVIGKKTHSTLRDLCSPENPKEKTFEALSEVVQQHFTPNRLEVAKSYRFHWCCQEENESVLVYSARLRHLAATCNFGEFMNCSLHSQFVCGIWNPATWKNYWVKIEHFKRLSKWLSLTKSRLKKLCKSNSDNCLNQLIQLRKNSQPYRSLLVEIQLTNLLRGRLLARFRPVSSQQLLMLVFHVVILIM